MASEPACSFSNPGFNEVFRNASERLLPTTQELGLEFFLEDGHIVRVRTNRGSFFAGVNGKCSEMLLKSVETGSL